MTEHVPAERPEGASASVAERPAAPSGARPPRGERALWIRAIGGFIFMSRWLQAPLYLGLIVAQLVYVWIFLVELWHLLDRAIFHGGGMAESDVMLAVLGLIDVVMVANLLIMVIVGGYETFVSRMDLDGHPDEPDWLSHVNENVLKVKLAMSIIGISSIHLLKTFIGVAGLNGPSDTGAYTWDGVLWQVIIHIAFLLSALALAVIDRMAAAKHAEHAPA